MHYFVPAMEPAMEPVKAVDSALATARHWALATAKLMESEKVAVRGTGSALRWASKLVFAKVH